MDSWKIEGGNSDNCKYKLDGYEINTVPTEMCDKLSFQPSNSYFECWEEHCPIKIDKKD